MRFIWHDGDVPVPADTPEMAWPPSHRQIWERHECHETDASWTIHDADDPRGFWKLVGAVRDVAMVKRDFRAREALSARVRVRKCAM